MLLESYGTQKIHNIVEEHNTKKEKFGHSDWQTSDTLAIVLYSLWIICWLFTILYALSLARANYKNSCAALILSILAWPFVWVFVLGGAIRK